LKTDIPSLNFAARVNGSRIWKRNAERLDITHANKRFRKLGEKVVAKFEREDRF
jgi:ribosomal protein L18E